MSDIKDRMVHRSPRYWYEDGLVELITGGLFVLAGLTIAAAVPLGMGLDHQIIAGILLPFVLIGGVILGRRLIDAAKKKITYPRTGTVEYQRPSRRQRTWRACAVTAALAAVVVVSQHLAAEAGQMMVLFQGTLTGMLLIVAGRHVPRFYVLGGLAVALGAVLSRAGYSPDASSGLLFGLIGAAMMASGATALARYLARNRMTGANGRNYGGGPAE